MRKPIMWFPTRSDRNQAVHAEKQEWGWKFCIQKVEELFYPCSENKGADQLCSADLRLCFFIYANCLVFHDAAQILFLFVHQCNLTQSYHKMLCFN